MALHRAGDEVAVVVMRDHALRTIRVRVEDGIDFNPSPSVRPPRAP
jgi:hypothetical protein